MGLLPVQWYLDLWWPWVKISLCIGPQTVEPPRLGHSSTWEVLAQAAAWPGWAPWVFDLLSPCHQYLLFSFLTHPQYQLRVGHLGRCTRKLWHSQGALNRGLGRVRRTRPLRSEGAVMAQSHVASCPSRGGLFYGLGCFCHSYNNENGILWCAWLFKLSYLLTGFLALLESVSWFWRNGNITFFWYFPWATCFVHLWRVAILLRNIFKLMAQRPCLYASFVAQNSKPLPTLCWCVSNLSLCHQVWHPDPMSYLHSLISAALGNSTISVWPAWPGILQKSFSALESPSCILLSQTQTRLGCFQDSMDYLGKKEFFEETFGLKYLLT